MPNELSIPTKLPMPTGPAVAAFTEVPAAVGVLHATADLLQLLGEFLAGADTAVPLQLGRFLAAATPDEDPDPAIEAAIMLRELTEATELLHALAGDTGQH